MSPVRFFSLVNTQARMNLKADAARFVLSYLWWVVEPLLFVLVFYFVFAVVLNTGRENYLFFLICGKIPFMWFQKSVVSASGSIVQNRGLISQIDMPKSLFPYVSVHEALYKQWVVFLVVFAVAIFYGHPPSLIWLWLLPLFGVQYGLILACSLFCALFVSLVRDFRMVINMGMLFLMFSSGVFFDVSKISNLQMRDLILTWNPIAFLLDAYRQVLIRDSVYDVAHLLALGAGVVIFLLAMHMIMHKYSKLIADKVVNS